MYYLYKYIYLYIHTHIYVERGTGEFRCMGVFKQIYLNKFTHMILGAGKPKIQKAGWPTGYQARADVAVLSLKSIWR